MSLFNQWFRPSKLFRPKPKILFWLPKYQCITSSIIWIKIISDLFIETVFVFVVHCLSPANAKMTLRFGWNISFRHPWLMSPLTLSSVCIIDVRVSGIVRIKHSLELCFTGSICFPDLNQRSLWTWIFAPEL